MGLRDLRRVPLSIGMVSCRKLPLGWTEYQVSLSAQLLLAPLSRMLFVFVSLHSGYRDYSVACSLAVGRDLMARSGG